MNKFSLVSRGTLAADPNTAIAINGYPTGTGLGLVTTGFPSGGPDKAICVQRVTGNDGYGRMQINDTNFGLTNASWTGVVVEVFNPNNKPCSFTVQILNTAGSGILLGRMVAEVAPGWQLVHIPRSNFASNAFTTTAADVANTVRYIRYNVPNTDSSGWQMVNGDQLYFGRIYFNPVQRPVFLLATDDGNAVNYASDGTGYPTGYPTSGGNYKAICDYYGFRATAYIRLDKVGEANHLTWDQLRYLRDAGWTIGSHSATHPEYTGNQGLRMLGPYGLALSWPGAASDDSAIYADICTCRDAMLAQGLSDAWHFALPQGGWDPYVRSACLRAGFKSVRAISSITTGYPIRGANHACGGNYGDFFQTGWIELAGAIQVDGTPTLANIQAYIDECIRVGATGSCYTHGLDAATAVKFDGMCDYLHTKQAAGLIRVMTVAEYFEQGFDFGGRALFASGALSLPKESSNAIGAVTRTIVMSMEPSAAAINKLVEFGE